jgi:hypothetical protein
MTKANKKYIEQKELAAVINRLIEEKKEVDGYHFSLGVKEALDWAKSARYQDLIEQVAVAKDDESGIFFPDEISEIEEERKEVIPGFDPDIYERGWVTGILRFWKKVAGALKIK